MDRKSIQKVVAINVLLFPLLFGLIALNKQVLRPRFSHMPFVGILTGSFPNFIAACVISLAFANPVLIRKPRNGRLIVYLGSALVFAVLAVEELSPMWGASQYYDPYDIWASGLGSLLSIAIFELVARRSH